MFNNVFFVSCSFDCIRYEQYIFSTLTLLIEVLDANIQHFIMIIFYLRYKGFHNHILTLAIPV